MRKLLILPILFALSGCLSTTGITTAVTAVNAFCILQNGTVMAVIASPTKAQNIASQIHGAIVKACAAATALGTVL